MEGSSNLASNAAAPAGEPAQDALAGRQLGQYLLQAELGRGGMGVVFRALDTALQRPVALKLLTVQALDDEKLRERFLREARSLARLSHPNLVLIYNVGSEGEQHYFAMELLEGQTLQAALRARGRIAPEELLAYAGQILAALACVHQHGVNHRDIKSSNIMLTPGRAVLMDFGLSKDERFTGLTSAGAVLGTPEYMPPEAVHGDWAGAPSDLYSLGVVLYEGLSGKRPFTGRSALAILQQHLETPAPSLEAVLPGADARLSRIVQKCLQKQPQQRYQDCSALAADLVEVLSTSELVALARAERSPERTSGLRGAARASGNTPLSPTVTAISAALAPVFSPVRRVWPHWVWGAAGFLGVLLLALVIAHGLKPRSPARLAGQPVLYRHGNLAEEIRWIEFDGQTNLIERRQPDGSWKRERIRHAELVGPDGGIFEFQTQDRQ